MNLKESFLQLADGTTTRVYQTILRNKECLLNVSVECGEHLLGLFTVTTFI